MRTCFQHPDSLIPDGVVLPCLHFCQILRECSRLKDANLRTINFIYCMLHMKLRFVNLLVNYIYELAANQSQVSAVNRILQSFHVNMEMKAKDQQRQLNGKMCKRFLKAFPDLIALLVPDEDTREQWKVAMDQWTHVHDVLSCQHYDKISKSDAEELPTQIRSFCVKMINLVGDAKRLQSFYFHSMMIGHIGEQFEYLYKEYGIPLGLLSLSAIEKRHETLGRRCFKKAIPEINLFTSGKSTSILQPDTSKEDSKGARAFYTLFNLLLHSFEGCDEKDQGDAVVMQDLESAFAAELFDDEDMNDL